MIASAASLSTASTSNLGGALTFFSRAPSDDFGGEIALTAGSENMLRGYARLETGVIAATALLTMGVGVVASAALLWANRPSTPVLTVPPRAVEVADHDGVGPQVLARRFGRPLCFKPGGGFGFLLGAFLCVFFVFHYGLFCAVHGTFLMVFVAMSEGTIADQGPVMMDVPGMFQFGLTSAPHVEYFVYAIIAFQALILIWEFFIKGEWKNTTPMAEMFAPYGRIIVLHFAIFAGAGALIFLVHLVNLAGVVTGRR